MVISRHGRYRFQTGIITAELLQQGISMDLALQISRQLRKDISQREEIAADELEALLEGLVHEVMGDEELLLSPPNPSVPLIIGQRGTFPFSRGILLRSLLTAGLTIEPAMEMASGKLLAPKTATGPSGSITRRNPGLGGWRVRSSWSMHAVAQEPSRTIAANIRVWLMVRARSPWSRAMGSAVSAWH